MPVDLINVNGQAQGSVADTLMVNEHLDAGQMRPFVAEDGRAYISVFKGGDTTKPQNYSVIPVQGNASTLRRDEWKQLDDAVLRVAEGRLGGIQDLVSRGLTYQLGDGMGTTVLEWHDQSDALSATVSMDAITRGKNDAVQYQYNYLPIPVIHVDYEIKTRFLTVSRKMGNPLDTTLAERATRVINETLEDMLFTNTTFSFGALDERNRNTIYSYVNHPDRQTVALSNNWDDSATSAASIIADVKAMKQKMLDNHFYGPFMIYIPSNYELTLDDDYSVSGQSLKTIRQRIMDLENIEGVKVNDRLAADNVVMVVMRPEVVRLVQGMAVQNVQWSQEGNMITKYKVMAIQVPQIRSDQNGKTGIVHLAA